MGRVRPPLRLAVVAFLALGLVACTDGDEGNAGAGHATDTTTSADGEGTEPTTAAGTEPPAALPHAAVDVVLRGDGLGVVDLGAAPDEAVEAVEAALGAPTRDTGWEAALSEYGTCPGERIRGIEWDHLVLLFTDGPTAEGDGQHLFAWRLSGAPPALGTATGFGWGATAVDAEELYPGRVEHVSAEEPFPAFLVVEAEGGAITAYLDDDEVVTNLEAGVPCGE